jgi:metal-responsive CopG/Arc/MetJ family transcriptional regulator
MSEARQLTLPDDLVEVIVRTARAQGRAPEELIEDAVRRYVSDNRWEQLLSYGKRQAERLGYTEDDVERLIMESRRQGTAPR